MKVEKDIIERAREFYKPEFRFIESAELFPPNTERNRLNCYASFSVTQGLHSTRTYSHLSCPEKQIIITQFAYVAWAQILIERQAEVEQTADEFLALQGDTMFLIDSRIRNRKPILGDRKVSGKIELEGYRESRDAIIILTNFNFENEGVDFRNKSCFGNLEFAIVKKPK